MSGYSIEFEVSYADPATCRIVARDIIVAVDIDAAASRAVATCPPDRFIAGVVQFDIASARDLNDMHDAYQRRERVA